MTQQPARRQPKAIIYFELWQITRRALTFRPKWDAALLYRRTMRELAARYCHARIGTKPKVTPAKYLR